MLVYKINKNSLRTGFEPARGVPIGFQVQRLNHSAIAASCWTGVLDIKPKLEALPRTGSCQSPLLMKPVGGTEGFYFFSQ